MTSGVCVCQTRHVLGMLVEERGDVLSPLCVRVQYVHKLDIPFRNFCFFEWKRMVVDMETRGIVEKILLIIEKNG